MKFDPPIENRETHELIIISKSSPDDYHSKAIELAKKELGNRKISQAAIDKHYSQYLAEHEKVVEQTITEIAAEDYSVFEKLWIVIFWPRELFHGWYLKREGYTLKANNRIKLILIGIILYALTILFS